MMQILRRENYPSRAEEADALPRSLYHCHTPTGELEDVLQFIVPMAHQVATINGGHLDAGHQGQQQTLYLLYD